MSDSANVARLLDGASDHGVSEALYLRDPDNNAVELYWDGPREQWPRTPNGELEMYTRPLNLNGLLREQLSSVNQNVNPHSAQSAQQPQPQLIGHSPAGPISIWCRP